MASFSEQLRILRRNSTDPQRGGPLTQEHLAELLGARLDRGSWPPPNTISNWERGASRLDANDDRKVLVAILQVLAEGGGVSNIAVADDWLRAGGYASLSPQEIGTVFPNGAGNSAAVDAAVDAGWLLRLEPPTYTQLFGIERSQAQIAALLTASVPPWIVAIEGMGGIGKTALGDSVSRHLMKSGAFADLAWVSARPTAFGFDGIVRPATRPVLSVEEAERAIAVQILGAEVATELLPPTERRQMLLQRLASAPHLVVIDNLESLSDVEDLLPLLQRLAKPTKFLLTSRQRTPGGGTVYHFPAPALNEADSLALIRHEAATGNLPHVAQASDAELRPLYAVLGGNPLALRLSVGQLHVRDLAQLVDDWRQATSQDIEALYTFIYRAAWETLEEECRHALLAMPMAAKQGGRVALLAATIGSDESAVAAALERLATLNLVDMHGTLHDRRFSIHSLTRSFLHKQVVDWWT